MSSLPHWAIRALMITMLMLIFAFAFCVSDTPTGLDAQSVYAQDGGSEPTDKVNAIDFYPDPLSEGALAFSLRDPWDHTDLTFYFHNCPSKLDCDEANNAIRQGIGEWPKVSALTFTEVDSAEDADIEITWVDSSTDPEGELGEVGGVLAYCYFPRYGGDMFIDDAEPWTIGDGGEFDLLATATHELGHGVGLGHSEFTNAIMYPYSGYAEAIGPDDRAAIQSLYGPPSGTTPVATNADDNGTDDPVDNTDNTDTDDADTNIIPTGQDVMTVNGSVDDGDSYQVWDLTVEAGTSVVIKMEANGSGLDSYVGLLDENLNEVLAENDDAAEGNPNSQLNYTFDTAGTYKVVATRYGFEDGTTSGAYALTVEFVTGGDNPGGTDNTVDVTDSTVVWRITNFADTDLCHIYFSASDAADWGPDQLGDLTLGNSFFFDWEVPNASYDLQVWDCFGNKLERYNVQANRNIDLQVYFDSIEVVPLGQQTEVETQPTTAIWRVTNYAGVDICTITFSPNTADTWGENRLDGVLSDGFYLEWELERDVYDIRIEDCQAEPGSLEEYEITVRGNVEIQVYQDQILVVPFD